MTDREFADVLRVRALQLMEEGVRTLRLRPDTTVDTMAAHVAHDALRRLKPRLAKLQALIDAAEAIYP